MSNQNDEEEGSIAAAVIVVGLILAALSDSASEIFVGLCGIAMVLAVILCIMVPIVFCYKSLNDLFGGKW